MPLRKKVRCSHLDHGVDIGITHGHYQVEAEYPVTVGQQFQTTAIKYKSRPALRYRQGKEWVEISYSEYFMNCIEVAKSFLKVSFVSFIPFIVFSSLSSFSFSFVLQLGLEKFHGVAILGCNSPEWFYSNFGAIFARWVSDNHVSVICKKYRFKNML